MVCWFIVEMESQTHPGLEMLHIAVRWTAFFAQFDIN